MGLAETLGGSAPLVSPGINSVPFKLEHGAGGEMQ